MAAEQLMVSPESLHVLPENATGGERLVPGGALAVAAEPARLESALPPELARRVVEAAISSRRPTRGRLAVEGEDALGPATLDLPLVVLPGEDGTVRLRTPEDAPGVEVVLSAMPDGRVDFSLRARYAGLPVDVALRYARFVHALTGEEGALYLTPEPRAEKLEILRLPLPLDPDERRELEGEVEGRLRFLEALNEIANATGTEIVYPPELDEQDVGNVEYVLQAIRTGWVAVGIADFATPVSPQGVEALLEEVDREGELFRAFLQEGEAEVRKVLDTPVNLGPSRWYISAARLQTTRNEMEEWLASGPLTDDPFDVRWEPVDGALFNFFYPDWPKPSLERVRRQLKAFEDEYGMTSDEFRRAREEGEARARSLEDGEIWLSFLEAETILRQGA